MLGVVALRPTGIYAGTNLPWDSQVLPLEYHGQPTHVRPGDKKEAWEPEPFLAPDDKRTDIVRLYSPK